VTRRTLIVLFGLELLAFAFLVFALVDRRTHLENPNGVNQWGFRGEARGERYDGEIRVALVGGSAAYEAATHHDDTLAMAILTQLQEVGRPVGIEYSIVNLAQPRVSAESYVDTLRRYAFLDADVVIVFDGYDAIEGLPPHAREHSMVFRTAGYLPILPARLLGHPAWLSDADGGTLDILQEGRTDPADVSCAGASKAYCAAMADTVRFALRRGRPIVVASPPSVSARQAAQQRSLGEMLTQTFGADPKFLYLDLGSVINLSNRTDSPDGIHRTVVGNHEVGQRIAVGILRLLERTRTAPISARAGDSR
jgi:hypothetical protein